MHKHRSSMPLLFRYRPRLDLRVELHSPADGLAEQTHRKHNLLL